MISSRGTHNLLQDRVSKLTLDTISRHQIHRSAEPALQELLELQKLKKSNGNLKIDKDVNVTVRAIVTSREGAEKPQAPNTVKRKLFVV